MGLEKKRERKERIEESGEKTKMKRRGASLWHGRKYARSPASLPRELKGTKGVCGIFVWAESVVNLLGAKHN